MKEGARVVFQLVTREVRDENETCKAMKIIWKENICV